MKFTYMENTLCDHVFVTNDLRCKICGLYFPETTEQRIEEQERIQMTGIEERENLKHATTGSKVTGHKAPSPKPPRK